jgi:hypothetical protein
MVEKRSLYCLDLLYSSSNRLATMSIPPVLAWMRDALAALRGRALERRLATRSGPQGPTVVVDAAGLLHFGSNDYLGLAADPRLTEAVLGAARRWGSGSSALVLGHTALHAALEARLAEFEATEAALVFPSGFAANAGTVAALVGPGDAVYADRKNHASLWDGCRLSRADVRVYPHGDCAALGRLLDKSGRYRRRLIVTDTLFSMDGDFALAELANASLRRALLVDEAMPPACSGARTRFSQHGLPAADRDSRGHVEQDDRRRRVCRRMSDLIDWLVNQGGRPCFRPPRFPAVCGGGGADVVRRAAAASSSWPGRKGFALGWPTRAGRSAGRPVRSFRWRWARRKRRWRWPGVAARGLLCRRSGRRPFGRRSLSSSASMAAADHDRRTGRSGTARCA